MDKTSLEKLVWLLIFGGLFALSFGYFLRLQLPWLGWLFIGTGGLAAAAGFVLIWVRSRMKP